VKILALETTDLTGSVAASDSHNLLLEIELEPGNRSAQSLAPAIKSLLQQVGWQAADVQLVAVTIGPGSFTGLRVGVTTAKTFAYAVGAEILGIDTLEAIAANAGERGEGRGESAQQRTRASSSRAASPESSGKEHLFRVEVVIDAQRGELVVGSFALADDGWFRPTGLQRLLSIDRWLSELQPRMAVNGPILKKLQSRIPSGITVLEERMWHPRAAQVARLAARDHAAGRRDDLWTLLPRYSRRSAAEEKLEKSIISQSLP
jgi:tRNA threonylcarbamoyladenosine biosynthesis protein TsaB